MRMKKFCLQSSGGPALLTVLKAIVVISGWICFTAGGALAGTYGGGSGTEADPYQISSVADWQELTGTPDDWNMCFILMNDLDLAGITNLTRVGNDLEPFTGTFDGDNHVISNAVINQLVNNVGLFGFLGAGAQITELGLSNPTVTGDINVGGLCGWNAGTIIACYVTGTVTGNFYVGGLCGVNESTISTSYATGSVTGFDTVGGLCGTNYGTITSSFSTGSVTGNANVGGLCGYNEFMLFGPGIISGCYATGIVAGSSNAGGLCGWNWMGSISTCYSAGMVTGTDLTIGGFVGVNDLGFVDGFWDMETSGQGDSAGGTGKTTIAMKTLTTYTLAGWDFDETDVDGDPADWWMPEGNYPRLIWERGDTLAPIVTATIPASIPAGMSFSLQGLADDSGTGESIITGAWYSIDSGTTWVPMTAVDSAFDSETETIEAFLPGGLPVGVYLVQLKAVDYAGNIGYSEPWLLAVYDRSAGYVVGVGWINSPAGALYPAKPEYAGVVGQVIFGFVTKYYKSASVPMGDTLFHFAAGNLCFRSTACQWLVVAGSRAQYKGVGMLNGAPGYGFMVTAIDGAFVGCGQPDRFRIKIWKQDTGEIVYDNQAGSNDIAIPDTEGTRVQGGNVAILRCR